MSRIKSMTTILCNSRFGLFWSLFGLLIFSTQSDASARTRNMEVIGLFFNVGNSTVQLNVISMDRKETTIMTLDPGRIGSTAIVEGEARVYTPSKSMTSGRLLSTCPVPTPEAAPEFFEKGTRTFYFRVRNGKVKLAKPRELTSREKRQLEAFKRQLQND